MRLNTGELQDDSKMPDAGKWEGVKMANIDPSWLIWVYDNKKCSAKVREYIEANYKDLQDEAHNKRR